MARHHSSGPTGSGRQSGAAPAPAPSLEPSFGSSHEPCRDPRSSVLAVTLEVLHAVAAGMPAEVATCRGLAREVGAAFVAHVAVDPPAGTASLVAWPRPPQQAAAQRILDALPVPVPHLVRLLALDRRTRCLSAEATCLGRQATVVRMLLKDLLDCRNVVQVPLDGPGPVVRLLVLGGTSPFGSDTVGLLSHLREPLSDLLLVARREPATPVPAPAPAGQLTAREVEVLRLMAQGLLARTIALRLQVSPRTVHKHLGNIYRKLDAHDRLVAVRRAERLGLLESVAATARPGDEHLTLRW